MAEIALFDTPLQEGANWVDTITEELGTSYKRSGYAALRATLHAIRDSLQMEQAVQFGEHLPILIRGIYYEGWDPNKGPARVAQSSGFMNVVRHDLRGHAELSDPERTLRVTFAALGKLLPPQEFEAIVRVLPVDIRELCQPAAMHS